MSRDATPNVEAVPGAKRQAAAGRTGPLPRRRTRIEHMTESACPPVITAALRVARVRARPNPVRTGGPRCRPTWAPAA